ncbi:hypothetical protein [Fusobacterium pseudoperiodonticum]|uniref:hypothetical protein n=1 Tax=Fusobacterium pseudoperiodonticum TaxID=2663009 RepID=UPI0028E66E90|nr:hypothetical protein [Fusobacterium pseudoperiodonticum]
MIKRMIILIIMGLTLSSCQLFTEAIKDNMYRVERARERKELSKKDGPGAIVVDKYKEDVERVIQDIKKRPINKKVEFGGTTLLIPENTRLNPKHGNIVDEKTGYGIAVIFYIEDYCTEVFYRKKVRNDKYILLYYNDEDKDLNVIGQKIIKANSLTNTCK